MTRRTTPTLPAHLAAVQVLEARGFQALDRRFSAEFADSIPLSIGFGGYRTKVAAGADLDATAAKVLAEAYFVTRSAFQASEPEAAAFTRWLGESDGARYMDLLAYRYTADTVRQLTV